MHVGQTRSGGRGDRQRVTLRAAYARAGLGEDRAGK